MWSRVIEIMTGLWMLMSPFIFRYESEATVLWANDFATGGAVILFGLLSYWDPTRHAHLLTLIVSAWLIGFAYWYGYGEPPPASQNHVVVGFLLAMFAVIPNDTDRPPRAWQTPAHP